MTKNEIVINKGLIAIMIHYLWFSHPS